MRGCGLLTLVRIGNSDLAKGLILLELLEEADFDYIFWPRDLGDISLRNGMEFGV